jgi:hypothetical protein
MAASNAITTTVPDIRLYRPAISVATMTMYARRRSMRRARTLLRMMMKGAANTSGGIAAKRAAMSLARLWRDQGKVQEARAPEEPPRSRSSRSLAAPRRPYRRKPRCAQPRLQCSGRHPRTFFSRGRGVRFQGRCQGLRLRHPLDVRVGVSARLDGRARGGMADCLKAWLAAEAAGQPELVDDAAAVLARLTRHRHKRAAPASASEPYPVTRIPRPEPDGFWH